MTKKQMEELADLIVQKLTDKQRELDKEFIKDLEASNVPIEVHERLGEKDRLIIELNSLIVMLELFEKAEDYEKAVICRDRIDYLKRQISKFN